MGDISVMNRQRPDKRSFNKPPQDHRKLQQLLEDQALILGLISTKLDVLKFIKDAHTNNQTAVTENAFLNHVAETYYRSLVIDFTALLGRDGVYDNNSLQQLYNRQYNDELPEERLREMRNTLGRYKPDKNPIKRLTNYRNKEIAHYDATSATSTMQGITAKFTWEHVDMLFELYAVAKKVVSIGLGKDVDLPNEDPILQDLKRLVGNQ